MKANLKPANSKARAMLKKLEALAERGVDGEKLAAQRKIVRLKARFDFGAPDPEETPDLFRGTFKRSSKARRICTFKDSEFDLSNSVKWAIESTTQIRCLHRDRDLLAEAAPAAANRLVTIAGHIANSFRTLLARFALMEGVSVTDRSAFVRGLYDGMMSEPRDVGQRLPSRSGWKKKTRGRTKLASNPSAGLHVHPYTVAFALGKQIRFSAPLQEIVAELDQAMQGCLPEQAGSPRSSGSP